jgi:membrane associated rhomboid family serine protease
MGMALVVAWSRRDTGTLQQIAVLVGLNLVITFSSSSISKGGHVGGLIGGALCALLLFKIGERRGLLGATGENRWIGTTMIVSLGVILYAACIVIARAKFPGAVG